MDTIMEMLLDLMDEDDMMSSTESLDILYQKEIAENKCLPYAKELDIEARQFLAEIKGNLGKAVMLRELQPGCSVWCYRLSKYIELYGMKFNKEDHILFIKLMYELVTIPDLEPILLQEFASMLTTLLRKKSLISPDELELPWRPLYEVVQRVSNNKETDITMYQGYPFMESSMSTLVTLAKIYFPLNATQEILDELRPTLFPFDFKKMFTTVQYLYWFLPVELSPEHHSLGYQLWFDEFMKIWEVCHNAPQWENEMMWLMAKLATHNIGYIDWEPYLPIMFTRIMGCFKLPVLYKQTQSSRYSKIRPAPMAQWIVSVMGNGSSVLMYLEKFAKAVETYVHPANHGPWVVKLKQFLSKLSYHMVSRLNRERYRKQTWETPIPDSHKLTDQEVDDFVKSVLPVAMIAMFNRTGDDEICCTLQRLATIRPNLVIPEVLDRMYATLDSLTEPHKLIAAMSCMRAVARPLVQGSRNINIGYAYPEGPSHVLPIMFSCLPGIDPNDARKCFVTLRLISVYASLIPIVDSSGSHASMEEDEREVCEATSRFEDFIIQFMDRVFALIDSSSLEFVRLESRAGSGKSTSESVAEGLLGTVFSSILIQTSDAIFHSALHKLRDFITERIFETKVAGQLAAVLCRTFSRINGQHTLKALVPALSRMILDFIDEGDEVIKDENLDERLSYAMLLLSEVVDTPGCNLLSYIDTLTGVLDKVLYMKSREGSKTANRLLKRILLSLTNASLYHTSNTFMHDYNDAEYPHFKDWGQGIDINALNVKWYMPGKEEFEVTRKIFSRYFPAEIVKLQKYTTSENSLSREELLNSLKIVNSIIKGSLSVLPIWQEEPLALKESVTEITSLILNVGVKDTLTMPDGSNIRRSVAKIMCALQETMLKNAEDDTKSFFHLTQIWSSLLLGSVRVFDLQQMRRKTYNFVKRMFEDKLVSKKKLIGPILLERISLQHELRKASNSYPATETHKLIMMELLKLATSRYANVRSDAQKVLFYASSQLENCSTILVPHLIDILAKDTEQHHEAYKGALYLLLGSPHESLVIKRDWSILRQLLPAIVLSKPSEKLSVIRLKDVIMQHISSHSSKFTIIPKVPENCVKVASELWETSPHPSIPRPNESNVLNGLQALTKIGQRNMELYNGLLDELLRVLIENNLHWRHRLITMNLITSLMHPDQIYSPKIVRYFLESLIHDSLQERKIAIKAVVLMLQQQKRKHPKVELDPSKFSKSLTFCANSKLPLSGARTDNDWLQYNSKTHPLTAEQWDEPRYIHNCYTGFYAWPKKIEIYAPSCQQPCLDPEKRVLTEHEKEVDRFFSEPQNVEKLVKFFSLEEKAGRDKFNSYRLLLFKGLFRNHGIVHLKHFLPHLRRLVADKQESNQRCAAELTAGIIKGAKHWPFDMTISLWNELLPVIRTALSNITAETVMDWVLCFATALIKRDPNRLHWLLECLMEEPLLGEAEVSFLECGRLYILQNALAQESWRVCELLQRLLSRVESRLLTNPFQNLRDRLGSLLVTIFNAGLTFSPENSRYGQFKMPRAQDFIDRVAPKLKQLAENFETDNASDEKALSSQVASVSLHEGTAIPGKLDTKDREGPIRLFKTVCEWIKYCACRSHTGALPGFYELYPVICQLKNSDADDELAKTSTTTLALLAQSLVLPNDLPAVLNAVKQTTDNPSWSVRVNFLGFLQVLIFHNMGTFLSNKQWVNTVRGIVLNLLEDERLEVREKAAQVLGGLLHCAFIPNQEQLLEEFKKKSRTKLQKRKRTQVDLDQKINQKDMDINALRLRHAGVLGLCAFIRAHPYDVPKYVPLIFEHLDTHFNDPQPIPATIRITLADFKRTHYDGWSVHAQQFTEEQLTVLQDLTVPPPHYS